MATLFIARGLHAVIKWKPGRNRLAEAPDGFTKKDARLEPRAVREVVE